MSAERKEGFDFLHTGLPDCAAPIISHLETEPPVFGLHGSGFYVRKGREVFFVTAAHCLGTISSDYGQVAGRLMLPYRLRGKSPVPPVDYVRFGPAVITAHARNHVDQFRGISGCLDIAVLPVTPHTGRLHQHLLSRSVKLPPSGEWLERAIGLDKPGQRDRLRFVFRGFPKFGSATAIEIEDASVVVQGASLIATLGGQERAFPHTIQMRIVEDSTPIRNVDGMSGGPVFLRTVDGTNVNYALAGMAVNGVYPVIHVITVPWITEMISGPVGIVSSSPPASSLSDRDA